jgi:hypothetical protein
MEVDGLARMSRPPYGRASQNFQGQDIKSQFPSDYHATASCWLGMLDSHPPRVGKFWVVWLGLGKNRRPHSCFAQSGRSLSWRWPHPWRRPRVGLIMRANLTTPTQPRRPWHTELSNEKLRLGRSASHSCHGLDWW